ncbi:MAG: hypothetical protein LBL71_02555 [Endomicrobium sp.]|jgi:hypothetical protein|nr:hypothetical protein [Endomicrobium sp.]
MKKIIALVLALGLAVPVQAWHLFPVREKIVIVKETDYIAMVVCAVIPACNNQRYLHTYAGDNKIL